MKAIVFEMLDNKSMKSIRVIRVKKAPFFHL